MEFNQKTHLEVEKGGKKVELFVDNDMPLGLLFDALMELKGYCVDRMQKAHQQEEEHAEEMKSDDEPEEPKED